MQFIQISPRIDSIAKLPLINFQYANGRSYCKENNITVISGKKPCFQNFTILKNVSNIGYLY